VLTCLVTVDHAGDAGLLDRVSNELSKVHDALDVLYFVT